MIRKALAAVLLVWEPLSLAIVASSRIDRLVDRGAWALVWLAVRLAVTGIGVAAGRAILQKRPGADQLATLALTLALAAALVTYTTAIWPPAFAPGVRGPAAALIAAWYLVLLVLLRASATRA